jgi:23S rRNA (cytidine1920-2'-O)/16S rRNA (cytidine1409-2'-O)-methyltransferase
VHRPPQLLGGEVKLRAAIAAFGHRTSGALRIAGRVAADIGACTGGFTRSLLDAGARRVYAIDAGHGQLLGSLRQDARVVNLEATNLGALSRELVPDVVEVMTIDVSYLSLANALPQLEVLAFADDAELVALVKPQFELGLDEMDPARMHEALARAVNAIDERWVVCGAIASPTTEEFLVHATRRGT